MRPPPPPTSPSNSSEQRETGKIPSRLLCLKHIQRLGAPAPNVNGWTPYEADGQPTSAPTAYHSLIPVPLHWQHSHRDGDGPWNEDRCTNSTTRNASAF